MAEPPDLSHARVLVTGGAGFIGSNFVHRLLARFPGAHVVVLDALTYAGRRENLDGLPAAKLTFVHGDIRAPAAVARAMQGCQVVLNSPGVSIERSTCDSAAKLSTTWQPCMARATAAGSRMSPCTNVSFAAG